MRYATNNSCDRIVMLVDQSCDDEEYNLSSTRNLILKHIIGGSYDCATHNYGTHNVTVKICVAELCAA